ncbi:hypothetical protein AB6A40_000512 [Gnathostoma spinigerum]|uniref:Uncharacterized protein n=1 Tax=Gnathostoma spinigerum TaxID=75299 RepID=A0ABD6E2C3_9BILA
MGIWSQNKVFQVQKRDVECPRDSEVTDHQKGRSHRILAVSEKDILWKTSMNEINMYVYRKIWDIKNYVMINKTRTFVPNSDGTIEALVISLAWHLARNIWKPVKFLN